MRFASSIVWLIVVANFAAAQVAPGDAKTTDQDRLQGKWLAYGSLTESEPTPESSVGSPIEISGNRVLLLYAREKKKGQEPQVTFTLDRDKSPKWIDIQIGDKDKKVTRKGIYEIKDDKVRVALTFKSPDTRGISIAPRTERPTSFDRRKPPEGCSVLVILLKRAKEEPPEEPLQSIAYNGFGPVALSPDGKWFAAAGAPGKTVRIWDTATGKEKAELQGHDSEVRELVPSRDGKRLFAATWNEFRVWDVAARKELQHMPAGPFQHFNHRTLTDDGRWLLSDPDMEHEMKEDGRFAMATIRLWETAKAREAGRFQILRTTRQLAYDYAEYFICGVGRTDEVLGTSLSHDGKLVAAGTRRGLVHLWESATGNELRTFGRSSDYEATPIGFSGDGKWLAIRVHLLERKKIGPPIIRLWEVATGKEKHAIKISEQGFWPILSDDGKWLVSLASETSVQIWDFESGNLVRPIRTKGTPITNLCLSADKNA